MLQTLRTYGAEDTNAILTIPIKNIEPVTEPVEVPGRRAFTKKSFFLYIPLDASFRKPYTYR